MYCVLPPDTGGLVTRHHCWLVKQVSGPHEN